MKICRDTETTPPTVERIGGADRYEVAVHASQKSHPAGSNLVFLASGTGFADALSASAAAGVKDAPVLLVPKDTVPKVVLDEIVRLAPSEIIILGGTASISAALERSLQFLPGTVSRFGGADRYEVAAQVARWAFTASDVIYVASGEKFPDALSAGAAAGDWGVPVLLTTKDGVPDATLDVIREDTALEDIVVVGGPATVSDSVVNELSAFAAVTRFDGADRYGVSAATSEHAFCASLPTVYVASGEVFPDALSGSAAAIAAGSPVLLVTRDSIPATVATELKRLDPMRIEVLGGPNTISQGVMDALHAYLRGLG
ncbi:cell wall-binding repeat-containing protein [Herbiconiux ginsengi]|uniref:cell wall-binding repeat-containing protein n=1 Tax=Herbiconiux ginsengi TaxID=381665 RepID=UPI00158774CA|nr:cell wall-binding repeat-containing protein [Herbiconiux ginsengi]